MRSKFGLVVLVFALAVLGWGQTADELSKRAEKLEHREGMRVVRGTEVATNDSEIPGFIKDYDNAKTEPQREKAWNQIREDLRLLAACDRVSDGYVRTDSTLAANILRQDRYREAPRAEHESWIAIALQRLQKLFQPREQTQAPVVSPFLGPWVSTIVWGLLALFVLVLLGYALRHWAWVRSLRRRAKALVDDDEPERTLDEWLANADELAARGRYREAVRALYVACLLKFDEAKVARFDRGETNWEHLARIQASATRPPELDFRPATHAFDRIWYGMRVRDGADYQDFRAWYAEVAALVARTPEP
ncbi:MAG: DUF4129 domain-containing protein [Fimbriimonas sp.]